jgi:uncharacterized membrane protein
VRPANAGMLVLCYLGLLAVLPLALEKNDREVQWHAKNGLLFFGAELLLGMTLTVFGAFLHVFLVFFPLLGVGILVLHVLAILKALNGGRLVIPGVSEFVNRF